MGNTGGKHTSLASEEHWVKCGEGDECSEQEAAHSVQVNGGMLEAEVGSSS